MCNNQSQMHAVEIPVIIFILFRRKADSHKKQKQFIFLDTKKYLTKGREIPFSIHTYSSYWLIQKLSDTYHLPGQCHAQWMRRSRERQSLVPRNQQIEQQAKDASAFCFAWCYLVSFPHPHPLWVFFNFWVFRCDLSILDTSIQS